MSASIEDYRLALRRFDDPRAGLKLLTEAIIADEDLSIRTRAKFVSRVSTAYMELQEEEAICD